MCYRLVMTEIFVVCGHTRVRQPFVLQVLTLTLSHETYRLIDCNSPNCSRSDYHTTQTHNCVAMCVQMYVYCLSQATDLYRPVGSYLKNLLQRNIMAVADNVNRQAYVFL